MVFTMVLKAKATVLTVNGEHISAITSSILSYKQAVGSRNSILSKL